MPPAAAGALSQASRSWYRCRPGYRWQLQGIQAVVQPGVRLPAAFLAAAGQTAYLRVGDRRLLPGCMDARARCPAFLPRVAPLLASHSDWDLPVSYSLSDKILTSIFVVHFFLFDYYDEATGWHADINAGMIARSRPPRGGVPVEQAVPGPLFIEEFRKRGFALRLS